MVGQEQKDFHLADSIFENIFSKENVGVLTHWPLEDLKEIIDM